jgi:hypothetical protein
MNQNTITKKINALINGDYSALTLTESTAFAQIGRCRKLARQNKKDLVEELNNFWQRLMTKILFCDVDGTLTGTVSGATFKSNPRDVLVLPGVVNALAHCAKEGYLMVGISNEGGVGAGRKKLEAAFEEKQYTCLLLIRLIQTIPNNREKSEYSTLVRYL